MPNIGASNVVREEIAATLARYPMVKEVVFCQKMTCLREGDLPEKIIQAITTLPLGEFRISKVFEEMVK